MRTISLRILTQSKEASFCVECGNIEDRMLNIIMKTSDDIISSVYCRDFSFNILEDLRRELLMSYKESKNIS